MDDLGFSQKFILSLDTGRTWSETQVFDSSSVYDVTFTDPYHGYAVGTNGLILKYNTSIIGIKNVTGSTPQKLNLYQNYPNPFNPLSKIKFDIPGLPEKGELVKLSVFDMLGKEVTVLVNGQLKPGTYEVDWQASGYPSGIYFYTLQSDGFRISKKMILIK